MTTNCSRSTFRRPDGLVNDVRRFEVVVPRVKGTLAAGQVHIVDVVPRPAALSVNGELTHRQVLEAGVGLLRDVVDGAWTEVPRPELAEVDMK